MKDIDGNNSKNNPSKLGKTCEFLMVKSKGRIFFGKIITYLGQVVSDFGEQG